MKLIIQEILKKDRASLLYEFGRLYSSYFAINIVLNNKII